jgi:hypothetical protein
MESCCEEKPCVLGMTFGNDNNARKELIVARDILRVMAS